MTDPKGVENQAEHGVMLVLQVGFEHAHASSVVHRENLSSPWGKGNHNKGGSSGGDVTLRVVRMSDLIKRILVYTHNAIGSVHAFHTLAVITGKL